VTVAAVVLAAGAATRFGSPKQNLMLGEVVQRVREGGLDDVVAVAGAHELETDVRVVACPDWERGPGASLRCGLQALNPDVEAAVVVLADGPDLSGASLARVVAAWRETGTPIVAASYGGVRGHPLLVARSEWRDVPDEGLRLRDPLLVPCDDLGHPGDVDRPTDLPERFRSSPTEPM
jgi:CTP:molybdopterin cytidylyltransferase MocA